MRKRHVLDGKTVSITEYNGNGPLRLDPFHNGSPLRDKLMG
jgi:hypothetical protein